MYNNQVYYTVVESNILANDNIATAYYTFFDRKAADAKLYSIWSYAANPPEDQTIQCFSAFLIQTTHDRAMMLESKVFDRRSPEPLPEPEEAGE